jgi:synaptobrevin family protein YKT6
MLTFVGRTVARKTQVGQRQTVQQEEYYCHAFNKDGLVGIAFVDADYPARAGFCVVSKVLEDFQVLHGDSWRGVTTDTPDLGSEMLQQALVKYQVGLAAAYVLAQWRTTDPGSLPACLHGLTCARRCACLPACLPGMQNPEAADKLAKIQRDLDETKIILHKTIESVLDRGEKLDQVRRQTVADVCGPADLS